MQKLTTGQPLLHLEKDVPASEHVVHRCVMITGAVPSLPCSDKGHKARRPRRSRVSLRRKRYNRSGQIRRNASTWASARIPFLPPVDPRRNCSILRGLAPQAANRLGFSQYLSWTGGR